MFINFLLSEIEELFKQINGRSYRMEVFKECSGRSDIQGKRSLSTGQKIR
jgi:hypothetical protein